MTCNNTDCPVCISGYVLCGGGIEYCASCGTQFLPSLAEWTSNKVSSHGMRIEEHQPAQKERNK